MMMESMPEIEKSITSAMVTQGPYWTPGYTYEEDNAGRRDWGISNTFSTAQSKKIRWNLMQRHAEFFDHSVPKVMDNGLGAAADFQLGLFNSLRAEGMQHFLSGNGRSTYSASGRLDTQITDGLESIIFGGRSLYYTAQALNHNVTNRYVDATLKYHPEGPWRASLRGRYFDLSDDNRRRSTQAELSRSLFFPEHLRLVYQFTYDEMKFVSPDYYSPQELRMHALGPELRFANRNKTEFTLRYLPSYAAERGGKPEIDQNVESSFQIRMTEKTFIRPSYTYSRTPTYRESIYDIEFTHYF
jgi:hypothetical protein